MSITVHKRLLQIAKREVIRIATKPMYLFCMVIAPIFSYIFFTTLMSSGLPTNMPAGVVDLDNTSTTRTIIRNLDAFQQTKIVAHYPSFADARKASLVARARIIDFSFRSMDFTAMVTVVSVMPIASFAMVLAVQGATSNASKRSFGPNGSTSEIVNRAGFPQICSNFFRCSTAFPKRVSMLAACSEKIGVKL